jgi:serine/threonine protein kinase
VAEDSEFSVESERISVGKTPAYCPPEVIGTGRVPSKPLEPSMDMLALGVIVYIMLTGVHPYD